MSKFRHYRKPLIFLGLLAVLIVATIPFWKKGAVKVPIYNGQPLTYWAEQHPSAYYEACRALGTNALPYLLSELEARDPSPRVLLQKIASSILPIGDNVFLRAGHRRYYAQLGLQQLDTNALPALLDLFITLTSQDSSSNGDKVFTRIRLGQVLSGMVSTNAEIIKLNRFAHLLDSDNLEDKRVACSGLTFTLSQPTHTIASLIVPLASHSDARLRQAALVYFCHHHNAEDLALPIMLRSLTDTNELVRMFAFNAFEYRRTNVTSAIPALLNLYSNLPPHLAANQNYKADLRHAIRQIDPNQTPP